MKKNLFSCLLLLFCASGVFVSCGDDDEKTTVGYSGKDISEDAGITRDKETKKAVLWIPIKPGNYMPVLQLKISI